MTPEQKAANLALLAEKVMGWQVVCLTDPRGGEHPRLVENVYGEWWLLSYGEPTRQWDPYASIADAMEMLDRFPNWDIAKVGKRFIIRIWGEVSGLAFQEKVDCKLQEAICAACLDWARAQGERNV